MADWLHSKAATVVGGAKEITFTDTVDMSSVRGGDVVMINGQIWECLSGTRPDAAGISKVILALPWPYAGAANVEGHVFRTTHDLLQIASDARKLTNITKGYLATQKEILTATTPTVDVPIGIDPATGDEEILKVTPWQYIINIVNASLGNIAAIGAMSEVQSEALRAKNNEAFAASGFVHMGKGDKGSAATIINEGLSALPTIASSLFLGRSDGSKIGSSKLDMAQINISGVLSNILRLGIYGNVTSQIKFSTAPDGKTTYKKSGTGAGEIKRHATVTDAFNYASQDPDNIEVVIDRQDMWGFEQFLEEVNTTNPFIYPGGCIQSQATIMDGVTTKASNRPVTYYAVYDGDAASKGKGVDFFALTDAQKKAVCGNHNNKLIYLKDGRLAQWRLRQRTIVGAGNGPFIGIDSNSQFLGFTNYSGATLGGVEPQGIKNTGKAYRGTVFSLYLGQQLQQYVRGGFIDCGVFQIRESADGATDTDYAINGECYFLMCGTVQRFNQGAKHPLNPLGTSLFMNRDGSNGSSAGSYQHKWHSAAAKRPISLAQCFSFGVSGTNKAGDVAPFVRGEADGSGFYGKITYGITGRDDQYKFYDAIAAGTVHDWRLSCQEQDETTAREHWHRKDVAGINRGRGKVPFTIIKRATVASIGTYQGGHYIKVTEFPDATNGIQDKRYAAVYNQTKGVICYVSIAQSTGEIYLTTNEITRRLPNIGSSASGWSIDPYTGSKVGDVIWLIDTHEAISAEYDSLPWADIIGLPSRIKEDFPKGIAGQWQGLPRADNTYECTRKRAASGVIPCIYRDSKTANWSFTNLTYDQIRNVFSLSHNANRVAVIPYESLSNTTKPAVNSGVHGKVGNVWSGNYHTLDLGNRLHPSLTGAIGKSTATKHTDTLTIESHLIYPDRLSDSSSYAPVHAPLTLGAPTNDSPAVKALCTLTAKNNQLRLQYHGAGLKHVIPIVANATGSTVTSSIPTNSVFHINTTGMTGTFISVSAIGGGTFDTYLAGGNLVPDDNGDYVNGYGGGLLYKRVADRTSSWGDDSKIQIVDNENSKTDLNGNTVPVFCHQSIYPLGWLKNKV